MADSFTMFDKVGNVCETLEEADRKELIYALSMYGFFGQEVELPYMLRALFIALKEDIDNSKAMRVRGAKGGRPRSKPEITPTHKPDNAKADNQEAQEEEAEETTEVLENENQQFEKVLHIDKPMVLESEKPEVFAKSEKVESQTNPIQSKPNQSNTEKQRAREIAATVVEVIDYLNEKTGKRFRASSKPSARHIRARIAEGYTVADFRAVVDAKVADWLGVKASDGRDMGQYLCPETLFGSKFEKYLNQQVKEVKDEYSRL